jgi:hypothetical protein|tara:strand:- start:514 stop:1314 length:801 start_codon:yes stop_codon:yes gene_type:complete
MNCEYCKKNFKSKASLYTHQKNTKYCIKIQQDEKEDEKEKEREEEKENLNEFSKGKICKFCDKVFTKEDEIPEHFDIICKVQLEEHRRKFIELLKNNETIKQDNIKLKETNNRLEMIIEYHSNNNKLRNKEIVNTFFNTTIESIKECINENLNYEYIIGGQEGIAKFVTKYLLKINETQVYTCINYQKSIFNFTNNQGDIIKDCNAKLLINLLWEAEIFQKVHKLAVQKFLDMTPNELKNSMIYYEDIRNMEFDNQKFRSCLLTLL